jgi:GxxExxY protein
MNADINDITEKVIGAAIEVHKALGPGLLESAYQKAMSHELTIRHVSFQEQLLCPVRYKDLLIENAYRLDYCVEHKVIVELKAVDALEEIHTSQVLTYLRFSGCRVGLLLNFKTKQLVKEGLRRLAL